MKGAKGSKKISGRSKNSWRRVDVTDLEDYIDDKLLQERLGTDFVSKPDDELFVVDTEPSDERADRTKNKGRLTKIQRRNLLSKEEPSCFRALVNESKVPDPSGKRNHTKPVTLSRRTIQKKINSGSAQRKLDNARSNRESHRQKIKELKESCFEFKKDLWDEEDLSSKSAKKTFTEWLSKDSLICNKLNTKNQIVRKKNVNVPSVSIPHEGTSYNPTYKAHQELLQNVVDDELKVIKEEKHIDRVTSQMFRKVTPGELQKEHIEQLMEGLNEKVSDDENNDGGEYISINPPVKNKKKDLKTRRHIKEHKLLKAKAKQEAIEKKKIADIYKLRFIKNAVAEKETQLKSRKLSRVAKKENTIKLPQICSKPFKEPPPTFQMSEDLSGNLRNLKPQGGGLSEHFVSLQRRGIASISKPITRKKAAIKRFKLSSHRMPWEQIERPVKSSKQTTKL